MKNGFAIAILALITLVILVLLMRFVLEDIKKNDDVDLNEDGSGIDSRRMEKSRTSSSLTSPEPNKPQNCGTPCPQDSMDSSYQVGGDVSDEKKTYYESLLIESGFTRSGNGTYTAKGLSLKEIKSIIMYDEKSCYAYQVGGCKRGYSRTRILTPCLDAFFSVSSLEKEPTSRISAKILNKWIDPINAIDRSSLKKQ